MILIQVQLAYVAVASLFVILVAAAAAAVGLVLGVHHYSEWKSLQISSCLTGAAEIIVALAQLYGVVVPYVLKQVAVNASCIVLLTASGLYYLCARLRAIADIRSFQLERLEIAFVCLWLISLLLSSVITSFSSGASWVAIYGPEEGTVLEKSDLEANPSSPTTEDMFNNFLFKKRRASNNSVHSLGTPVDIPAVPVFQGTQPGHSPRLSWVSSIASVRSSHSLDSLASVLDARNDARNVTPPTQQQPGSSHQLTQSQHSLGHSDPKSPSLKTPRSPIKLRLSRSSFSLKRSASKASQGNLNKPSRNNVNKSPSQGHQQNHPVEPVSLGIPQGLQMVPGSENQKNWVIIPNENPAESRSVSGSSQLTGTIFPASEYNRRINAAGFQKDEPVPVQVHAVRNTLSQYDLECLHKQSKGHL